MLAKTKKRLAFTVAHSLGALALGSVSGAGALAMQDAPARATAPSAVPVESLPAIRIGESVDGSLPPGEPAESRFNDYRLHLDKGDSVQIDLSAAFDTYLELRRPGSAEPIDSNDDNGESLNSRIIFTAADGGDYIVHATRLYSGDGPFRLAVGRVVVAPHETIGPGQIAGAFDSNTTIMPGSAGSPVRYRLYDFHAVPGERVQIEMTSPTLTAQLEVIDPGGTVLTSDSAAGDSRTARLLFVVPREGFYTLRATAPAAEAGSFSIALRKASALVAEAPAELRPGVPVFGRFSFDSAAEMFAGNQIRYYYRDFLVPVRRGETLTLEMSSSDFDSYLEAGVRSPIGFAVAGSDDDSAGNLNSRLVLHPDSDGTLTVRARTLRSQTGCYTVRLTPGEPPPAAAAAAPATPAPAAPPTQCPSETARGWPSPH
jgi:hypothetical protein